MATKKAFDQMFIDAAIKTVAEVGIENTHTKDVAALAGFSEATLFRLFGSKEGLLRDTFLYIDKRVSDILSKSALFKNSGNLPLMDAIHEIWKKEYRYLLDNKDHTIFLIRYRYSSLYTPEVRNCREAYNGSFDDAYSVLEKEFGKAVYSYRGFIINYIFELTLCFAEKIISRNIEDNEFVENSVWSAVYAAVTQIVKSTESMR